MINRVKFDLEAIVCCLKSFPATTLLTKKKMKDISLCYQHRKPQATMHYKAHTSARTETMIFLETAPWIK